MKTVYLALRIAASVALIALCLMGQNKKTPYTPRDKAFFADPNLEPTQPVNIKMTQKDKMAGVYFLIMEPNLVFYKLNLRVQYH